MEYRLCKLVKGQKQLILGNGSERGEFLPVKNIFDVFSKPHDGIQIMKTYYPYHDGWNTRDKISKSTKKVDVDYAWDYEYDDYHPLDIFEDESKTLAQLREIKTYGSDIHLTLTMDPTLSDMEVERIFNKLKGFGRIYLRINHEQNGDWFEHNKNYTRKEVAEFFVRCHHIAKRISREFYTVFNISADSILVESGVSAEKLELVQDKLKDALSCADFWSIDKYISLNYGWPFYELKNQPDDRCFNITELEWWNIVEESYIQMIQSNGGIMKPLFINEFNADSDVDGFEGQVSKVHNIFKTYFNKDISWLKGIVMYQFEDEGGLGLMFYDDDGELQSHPLLKEYKNVIGLRKERICERNKEEIPFRWLNSDVIEGISIYTGTKSTKFYNQNEYKIFLYNETDCKWSCLLPEESVVVQTDKINVFVPPYVKDGELQYSCDIENVEEWVQSLVKR